MIPVLCGLRNSAGEALNVTGVYGTLHAVHDHSMYIQVYLLILIQF